ncbi:MAG: 3-deoxy-D-manno-octulosonic acid transferase [Chitinophagales bacterium]
MLFFSKVIYNLGIRLYYAFIWIASFFNEKAKHFINGRKKKIEQTTGKVAWFHCASLGEFEQAVPLINLLKKKDSNYKIVLTFFSPSGYEVKKNTALADVVYYLPIDTKKNAKEWIKKINPNLVFFVKYEFWWHYLNELNKQEIPAYLVSSIFRKEQIFFKFYGHLFRKMLEKFSHIFVQDDKSAQLLSSISIKNTTIAFDTRFDQVKSNAINANKFPAIENFINEKPCIVVGSSWLKDEILFKELLSKLSHYKIIIAPHDINTQRLKELKTNFSKAIFYSEIEKHTNEQVLIIDNYGMLTSLYQYADIAYIGGAFGVSVHNVLEAAVYGVPLIFGANYHKSKEAIDLIKLKAAHTVKDSNSLFDSIQHFNDKRHRESAIKTTQSYIDTRLGGTTTIFSEINL